VIKTNDETEQAVCGCRDSLIQIRADRVDAKGKSENEPVSIPDEALPSLWW
jgi:hypothetical protein